MADDQDRTGIRNISIYIIIGLALLAVILYFLLPLEISAAIIISSFLAFIVFALTFAFYRWISRKGSMKAARLIMFSFIIKIIVLAAVFYLVFSLDFVNTLVFGVSFVVFFTIFLNLEIFLIYKKILFK
ncbi:MAG: hypothetical protein K8S14_05120, partial [Actinomycetia bacterium]|nr:hypothetical protein [Actinomycetes bacterium]